MAYVLAAYEYPKFKISESQNIVKRFNIVGSEYHSNQLINQKHLSKLPEHLTRLIGSEEFTIMGKTADNVH